MDEKRSISFCRSPGFEVPEVRMNLESVLGGDDEEKSDNMCVFARLRPMLKREIESGYSECIGCIDDSVIRGIAPQTSQKYKNSNNADQEIIEDFKYTKAFDPETTQFVFFEQTILKTMLSFIEGQNSLVFSYGITNSGKTYTLQGDNNNPGIIVLALKLFFASVEHQLFDDICAKPDKYADIIILGEADRIRETKLRDSLLQTYNQETGNKSSDSSANLSKSFAMILCECFSDKFKPEERETTLLPDEMESAQTAQLMRIKSKESADKQVGEVNIWISFIEIYNEYIYDLLQSNILERKKLALAEDQNGDVYVKEAKEVCVSNVDDAIKLLHFGRRNLRIACTKLNYQSSRSHCIYTIKVVRLDAHSQYNRVNRLSFCDLAGSERAGKSKASGMRLKEASYINTSLLVLGRCLEQLRLNQTAKEKKMIPFRESKLTRLFSGHFLGKGSAVMIANVSPCEYTFDETINALRFSSVAKQLIVKDSYINKASNSLQSISNQYNLAKDLNYSLDQSWELNNSYIDAKNEMIEKLLDLADNLRAKLQGQTDEMARMETTIRNNVCEEFSKYSDELLARQKNMFEEQAVELKVIYNKRLEDMLALKDTKIRKLEQKLADYEASTDESFNESMDQSITFDSKGVRSCVSAAAEVSHHIDGEIETKVLVNDMDINGEMKASTDALSDELDKQYKENQILKLDLCSLRNQLEMSVLELQKKDEEMKNFQKELEQYQEQASLYEASTTDLANVKSAHQSELEKLLADLNALKEDLNLVATEKDSIKEQLDQTTSLLKESQSNEMSILDKCSGLDMKLQEALQVLKEYEKEIAVLKAAVSTAESKSAELRDEKQKIQESVLALSDELESSISLIEKLHKEKLEMESLLDTSKEILEGKVYAEAKCSNLESNLIAKVEEIEKQKIKINDMELEYAASLKQRTELLEKSQKDYLNVCHYLEENKLNLSMELEKATQALQDYQSKIIALESECEAYKNESIKLLADCESYKEQIATITSDLENMRMEKANVEKVNEELMSSIKSEKDNAEEQISQVGIKLEEAHDLIEELEAKCTDIGDENEKLHNDYKMLESKLADTVETQRKSLHEQENELNLKLADAIQKVEAQNLKITQMEVDCKTHSEDYDKMLETYQNLKLELKSVTEDYTSANLEIENLKENVKCLEEASETLKGEKINVGKEQEKTEELSQKLEEAKQTLSEHKSRIMALESECEAYQNESVKLFADCKMFEEQINSKSIDFENLKAENVEINKVKEEISSLKSEKCDIEEKMSEVSVKLNKATEMISQQENVCSSLNLENKKLLEENTALEEKLENATEAFDSQIYELNNKLEEAAQFLEAEKCKRAQMAEECKIHTDDYNKAVENYHILELEFKTLSEQMLSATKVIDDLRNEKQSMEDALHEMKSNVHTVSADTDNTERLNSKISETTNLLEQKSIEVANLEKACRSHEEEISLTMEINKSLEEKCTDLSSKLDAAKEEVSKLELKLIEVTNASNQVNATLTEVQSECCSYQDSISRLNEEKKALEEKSANDKENEDDLTSKLVETTNLLEQKNMEITNLQKACHSHQEERVQSMEMNKNLEEKCTDLSTKLDAAKEDVSKLELKLIEVTNASNLLNATLTEVRAECSSYQDSISKLNEEKIALEGKCNELTAINDNAFEQINQLKNKNQLVKEDFAKQINKNEHCRADLVALLEMNECKATEKIILLESKAAKQLKDIADLERQIREKENSIAQLEKAVVDIQEQMKELELENNSKLFALKQQHEIEITQSMNLKAITEKENAELKVKNSELKKETSKVGVKTMPKVKREKVSAALEVGNVADNKENSDNHSDTSKECEKDSKSTKRRRPLRSRQAESKVNYYDSESDAAPPKTQSRKRKSSEEFQNSSKQANKKHSREVKPTKRTLRTEGLTKKDNVKENAENMSPAQRIAAYMGSKIKSVAQSVANMPSPRMTRGRRKLFNVDTDASSANKNWKY